MEKTAMKGATWQTWDSQAEFEKALAEFDTASKVPLRAVLEDGSLETTDLFGVRNNRTRRTVGAVRDTYLIHQVPTMAHEALDALQATGAKFRRAELWANDSRQWLGLYTDPVKFGGDASPYSLGFGTVNSFDGSLPVEIGGISVRVVCENTLAMARKSLDKCKHNEAGNIKRADVLARLAADSMQEVRDFGALLTQARETPLLNGEHVPILQNVLGQRAAMNVLNVLPRYVLAMDDGKAKDAGATDGLTRWSLHQAATDWFSNNDGATTFQARMGNILKANDLLTVQVRAK